LDNASGKFNWCVYGSDAPPNVTAENGTYTLVGTPPFILTAAGGATQTVAATTIATSAVTVTPVTLTDETGCPGVFCAYTGNDLLMDASHLCQLRTSSVQYWEAYIKDTRDDQVYRITQFSDDSWWMAEDLKYAGGRIGLCGTTSFYRGNNKPDCPAGWAIPTLTQVLSRNTGFADPYGASYVADKWYRPTTKTCDNIARMDQVLSDCNNTIVFLTNGKYEWNWNSSSGSGGDCSGTLHNSGRVRCFRQL
jgi:hypothetical protein